jgi:hypothetical protein
MQTYTLQRQSISKSRNAAARNGQDVNRQSASCYSGFSLDPNYTVMERVMARTYLIFGDIEGKLDVLRVECARCQRKGRYSVRRLIEKYGRHANMMKWKEQLNGDCPKRDAPQLHDRCDLICPDLPKVL